MKHLKHLAWTLFATLIMACQSAPQSETNEAPALKNAYAHHFLVGTALNTPQCEGSDTVALALVNQQYNSVVAENCMKFEVIQPQPNQFDFRLSDQLAQFAAENKHFFVGHTLVWHSQTPDWVFQDEDGQPATREMLIHRMQHHIHTVVGRYKGKVHGWDVVNEALNEDGSLRESPWYNIIGPDYIELAFTFAHEADPEAELYYNDYNMYKPEKREGAVRLAQTLKNKGIRIDGIGMQAHYALGMDVFSNVEQSILAFHAVGVNTMITELDVSVLPFPTENITADVNQNYALSPEYNPHTGALPDSVQTQLADYYAALFNIYNTHSNKISRVTFWGVNDAQTWRNNWPVKGRTDHPLLFDRSNQPKPAFEAVLKKATPIIENK